MDFGTTRFRFLTPFAAAGFMLVAAGCQSNDNGTVLAVSGDNAQNQAKPETISVEELRAYCPRVSLRSGTAFYNSYEKGGQDDPAKIVYQAAIEDVTRSCKYEGGRLTMNVAVAGRVVPGPLAKAGTITMPIRVAALRGEEVLYSELSQHSVSIAQNAGATQFVFNDPNVSFEAPTARNIQIFVGYDEGPAKAR